MGGFNPSPYLVMDSTAPSSRVAQSLADPKATFGPTVSTRHATKLLDGDGVIAELGRAHEGTALAPSAIERTPPFLT